MSLSIETAFLDELRAFAAFGTASEETELTLDNRLRIPVITNEFWTARQRDAHSLHEISYRACFKPQLPRFFVERLTSENDRVFDPFMGRGTTLIEAALMKRRVGGCDINPLSLNLIRPRLNPPTLEDIKSRLSKLSLDSGTPLQEELLVFFHPDTLREIAALREYFISGKHELDVVDHWIRMVATNRLTGHSSGFFSVYTLPPNQAVSVTSQQKINEKRNQSPEYRHVAERILRKSRSLLKDCSSEDRDALQDAGKSAILLNSSSDHLEGVADNSVSLVVTSPPFLDVVNYTTDNWLRCWFNGIDASSVPIWQLRNLGEWEQAMEKTFRELHRILKPRGWIAFEVGEVRKGNLKLEENVAVVAAKAGLIPVVVMINQQEFTKTAACWGISNLAKGTNSNRIVVLRKA